ncbi:hypothetical protein N7471_007057 [Penicillium samsonianum]|uniref:uncharacterized protein n=1 Tax=Penicillium samsonianum TaxID=1882272 RepID=UPI0025479AA3|nr:uncharacterized protein N7471_007057 [Penicillium samsonianum]KAJ6131842.1 hypothetical protein N7471_007057 [Penicillium samsonianum]
MPVILLTAVLVAAVLVIFFHSDVGEQLPPGPRGLPLIGNLHQIDQVDMRKKFARWHQQYGPVIRLKLGWSNVIVLGTIPTTKDLFGKKGARYSSRPDMTMARDVMTKNMQTSTLPYGDKWKIHNRIHVSLLNPRMSQKYRKLVQIESRRALFRLLNADDMGSCFNRLKFNIIYTLAYGKDPEQNDADFREILDLADSFSQALTNSTWIVDIFPILNRLPTFLAPWKRFGDKFHERTQKWFQKNTAHAIDADSWSWTKLVMTSENTGNLTVTEIRSLIGVLFEAGVDSTATSLHFFVLACILYPDAVERARTELDDVVGRSRLPTLDDLPEMPYVQGFVKEVLRWRPILQGLPHYTTADDTYMGYHIPKGSTVLFNHWSAHQDEDLYPEPSVFRPERYIKNPDLPLGAFGYGRRSCPGRHLAMMTLETMIPSLLWAFDFHSSADLELHKDALSGATAIGAFLKPLEFPVVWKVRDGQHKGIVEDAFYAAEKELNSATNIY